jgi:hypothetical protein
MMLGMFKATFIGHQGWLFSSGRSHVLLDAMLMRNSTDGAIYPPRDIDFSKLPPIDAYFLSHSHEDHFDVPTLNRMDRRIPIYTSARVSVALVSFLREMGFQVILCYPGDRRLLAPDLEMCFFSPDQLTYDNLDEWDPLPFVFRDIHGDGNFVSFIDVSAGEREWKQVREFVPKIGIWCVANNSQNIGYSMAGKIQVAVRRPDSALFTQALLNEYNRVRQICGSPAMVAFTGAGWSYEGELAYLNQKTFAANSEQAASALHTLYPDQTFLTCVPGQTITMKQGKVVEEREQSPFMVARPREQWPDRTFRDDGKLVGEYSPYTGRYTMTPADMELLRQELQKFAPYIYGSLLFRWLYSQNAADLEGRRPTVVLALMVDEERSVELFEYDPTGCCFVPSDVDDPVEAYACGFEAWASDLLALLRGDAPTTGVWFGRYRAWNNITDEPARNALFNPPSQIWGMFYKYVHPLRTPARALYSYRQWLSREPSDAPILVQATAASPQAQGA